jgi:hypothetical protein
MRRRLGPPADRGAAGPGRTDSARLAGVVAMAALMAGCAGPRPVLYPNEHYQSVGPESAQRDVADCRRRAEAAGASPGSSEAGQAAGSTVVGAGVGAAGGAVGGAIVGAAGTGAAIGAASGAVTGLLAALFRRPAPSPAYTAFVDRCLRERGYETTGWS